VIRRTLMQKEVQTIPADSAAVPGRKNKRKLRVAAYCRVSTDEEKQLGSFENQIEYFTKLISANTQYELVKIYCDEGISGCSTRHRAGFNEMICDCEEGKIDLIITKSISRFARNTQDSLNYTRRLKEKGIGIYFEKEGINTMESSGELLLTLFSCFAQEESRSISENTSWGIRSKFKQGIPHINATVLLGYDKDSDGNLVINEGQAETVKRIYSMFLEGFSLKAIARILNREEVPGVHGEARWCAVTICRLIENEKYKGAMLMQKTYTVNYLTKQSVKNTGQMPRYYIEKNHQPIIDPEIWQAAQEEMARRRKFTEEHGLRGFSKNCDSVFYSRLFCGRCGEKMLRSYQKGASRPSWYCGCCNSRVGDDDLRNAFCRALNSIVLTRQDRLPVWREKLNSGTALEKLRAEQMIRITAAGTILYEIPELTQAILQEAWLHPARRIVFRFLSGEEISIDCASVSKK